MLSSLSSVLSMPPSITVYGSSSRLTPSNFLTSSYSLGCLLASKGWVQVNGGGNWGCMGELTKGGLENGGEVKGVIHER
jgi:predicted Rossmann-fold nucleotide-binding protein